MLCPVAHTDYDVDYWMFRKSLAEDLQHCQANCASFKKPGMFEHFRYRSARIIRVYIYKYVYIYR